SRFCQGIGADLGDRDLAGELAFLQGQLASRRMLSWTADQHDVGHWRQARRQQQTDAAAAEDVDGIAHLGFVREHGACAEDLTPSGGHLSTKSVDKLVDGRRSACCHKAWPELRKN